MINRLLIILGLIVSMVLLPLDVLVMGIDFICWGKKENQFLPYFLINYKNHKPIVMSTRKQPETSLEAYRSLEPDKIQQIYKDIMGTLAVIGEGTFEDIAAHLKIDKSRVWKRLSEMGKLNMIYNTGRKRLLKSNRNGFTWMLTTEHTPKTDKQENVFRNPTTFTDHAKKINQLTQPQLFQ